MKPRIHSVDNNSVCNYTGEGNFWISRAKFRLGYELQTRPFFPAGISYRSIGSIARVLHKNGEDFRSERGRFYLDDKTRRLINRGV